MTRLWTETMAAGRLICKEKAPYFQVLLHGLVTTVIDGMGTIGVTNTNLLLVDPKFIDMVTPEQMGGLFCHEILHVTCGHVSSERQFGRDHRLLGIAQDLAINPMVIDMGFQLPTGDLAPVLPESKEYPKSEGFVRGLSQDEYYELLLKKQEREQKKQGNQGKGNGGQQGQGEKGAGGAGEPEDPNDEHGEGGAGGDADHDHDGAGTPRVGQGWCGSCSARPLPNEPQGKKAEEAGARSEAEMQRMIRATAEAVRDAANGPGRGRMPAGLTRWAEDMLKPAAIPWNTKLRRAQLAALAWQAGAVDHRYDGPSRRQAGLGFGHGAPILPRLRAPKPIIDVIGDTSGSMSKNEISVVASETMAIVKSCGATVRFAACDANTQGVRKITTAEELADAIIGGGGTDMRPAFRELMKQTPKPKVIICITDGMVGDGFPTQPIPGVRVIIVLCGPMATKIPNTEWAETIIVPPGAKLGEAIEESAA